MQVNMINSIIEQPKHDIGDNVLFFNHVDGCFNYGIIVQIQVTKTEAYSTIAYGIKIGQLTIPCISDKLVFEDKDEANEWIDNNKAELNKNNNHPSTWRI